MQNGFFERFNASYRRGVLDRYVFRTLGEAYEQTEPWLANYNEQIPRDPLNNLTPVESRLHHAPKPLVVGGTKQGNQ